MSDNLLPVLLRPLQWGETPVGDGEFLLPTGTVTLLLADGEGSTAGWEADSDGMARAITELESATVAGAVSEVIRDHLTDVIDDSSGPVILLRMGARHPIPPGSWIIDCTGHLTPRGEEYVPYVSPSGRSMSINSTSTAFINSAVSAYFLSHLFFLDKLVESPLYELDLNGLGRDAPEALLPIFSALIQHNLSIVLERVPMHVFHNFKLDFDQWYPLPRQIPGLIRLMLTHKRNRPHHRQALDTFSQHSNVRCGLLSSSMPCTVRRPRPPAATTGREYAS